MAMDTPTSSSLTEAHLNDLAARTVIETSGGFTMVDIPDVDIMALSECERNTIFKKALELQRGRPVDADDLTARLRDLTPPVDSEEEREEHRELEYQARKELEDDGCSPCYPVELGFPVLNPPEKYQAIIRYWRRFNELILGRQKQDWEVFRRVQKVVRSRNRPFSEFVDKVRERRQRHGLGGHVHLLYDAKQQDRLNTWMDFQNRHLKHLEEFQKERDELKQELKDEQSKGGDKNTERPKFGPTHEEAIIGCLKLNEQRIKSRNVLLHWIEQQRLAMDPEHPTPIKGDHDNQDIATKAVLRTSKRKSPTKQTEGPSILGKVRVTKADPKKRNVRKMSAQKPKASKLEPPIRNSEVVLQNGSAQASQHPKTKARRTKIERELRQLHPERVAKANRNAGNRTKSSRSQHRSSKRDLNSSDR